MNVHSLSELKVLTSFCFAFKIPDDVAASNNYILNVIVISRTHLQNQCLISQSCDILRCLENKST